MSSMELSPQAVAAATFKTVKRGYDPDEVRAYLIEVSASLEASHQQATAMEARARAAIAKLQDATQHVQSTGPVPVVSTMPSVGAQDAEAISRILLLAQRTADSTVAEALAEASSLAESAQLEATGVTASAKREAAAALEQARAEAARMLDEARAEALRAKSEHHVRAEAEVRELQARRDTLIADVDSLERHAVLQRDRLRETAEALAKLADDVPVGFERPMLATPISGSTGTLSTGTLLEPLISNREHTGSHLLAPPAPAGSIPNGPITGQVPLQPGVEPLVSPRPTSADEVRSMWAEAERAERAEHLGLDSSDEHDATPVEGGLVTGSDEPTPSEGIRR